MKSSILRLVFVCGGALVVGACSSGGASHQQPVPVLSGPDHSEVTLDRAGTEPRRLLRFAPTAGTQGMWAVEKSYLRSAASGVQNMRLIDVQERSKAEWEVKQSDAASLTVRWRWSEPPSIVRIDGEQSLVNEYRAGVEGHPDVSWHTRVRNATGDEPPSGKAMEVGADGAHGQFSMGTLEPCLPEQEVGAGASWTVVRTGESGVERATMRVVSMSGADAVIEFSGTSRAPAHGASMGAEKTWSGRVRWMEGLPDWSALTLDARTFEQVQRTPDSPQMVDVSGRAKLARTCIVR